MTGGTLETEDKMAKFTAVENVKAGGVHYEKGETFQDDAEDVKEALDRGLIKKVSDSESAPPLDQLREQRKVEFLERKITSIGPAAKRAKLREEATNLRNKATEARAKARGLKK